MRKFPTVLSLLGLMLLAACVSTAQREVILASTSWTAALARGAGVENVQTLAPANLQDPARYELTVGDLARIRAARWVIYSGEECFADDLVQAAGNPARLLKVRTENTPQGIAKETAALAAALGTQTAQTAWIAQFQGLVSRIQVEINAVFPAGTKVIVHRSQADLARWLGFDVLAEVGAQSNCAPTQALSPAQIDELAEKGPALVLDSYHDPVGPLLAETAQAIYVQLISYPGPGGSKTLEDVFRYNREQIAARPPQRGEKSAAEKAIPRLALGAAGFLLLLILSLLLLRRLFHRLRR